MEFSIVIPAHNEAALLPRCIASIRSASAACGQDVEIIVSANRCTDATAEIGESLGALIVESGARNIASVRNAGATLARGTTLVTIDADCVMSPLTFNEIAERLNSGRFVGGGTRVKPERWSPGIAATYGLMELVVAAARVGGGIFWLRRSDFEQIGGFDESVLVGEDVEFARRLKAHGRRSNRKFTTIRSAPVIASCRKFDEFGDWHMFAMAMQLRQIQASVNGTDTKWVDRYFFDFNS